VGTRFGLKLSEGLDFVVVGDGFDIGAVTFRDVDQQAAFAELVGQAMCKDRGKAIDVLKACAMALDASGNRRLADAARKSASEIERSILGADGH
jgi:hypothetical protein